MNQKYIVIVLCGMVLLIGGFSLFQKISKTPQKKKETQRLQQNDSEGKRNLAPGKIYENQEARETILLSIEGDEGLKDQLTDAKWEQFYWKLEEWMTENGEGRRRGRIVNIRKEEGAIVCTFQYLHEDITKEFHQIGCRIYSEEDRYEFAYE